VPRTGEFRRDKAQVITERSGNRSFHPVSNELQSGRALAYRLLKPSFSAPRMVRSVSCTSATVRGSQWR